MGCERADNMSIVLHTDWLLRFGPESTLPQFPDQRILINRFKKSWSESRVYVHCETNDLATQIIGFRYLFDSVHFVHSVRLGLRDPNHETQIEKQKRRGEEEAVD